MSSKLFPPDGSQAGAPLVFRQLRGGAAPADAAVDATARMEQMAREAEQRVQQARAAGLREGEAAGRNRAAAEIKPAMDRLAQAIGELAGLRGRLRREAEADMVRLSLAIARRVLRRELAVDPEALHGLVLGALEKLDVQEIARVRVHPSHAALLSACLREAGAAKVEVVADAGRDVGGVVFETGRGNLDASVESQLQEIERGLTDRLGRNQ